MVVHGPYPVGEPRVAREARVALDSGYEVDVVAMRQPGDAPAEEVDGARVFRLPFRHRRGAGAAAVFYEYVGFTLLATMRVAALNRRRRYRAIHVHNPPDFLLIAALLPRLLGSKVVFDIHDFAPDLFAMRFTGRRGPHAAERLLRKVEAWATRLADAVITVHEPYRRELIRRGVPADKITVVLNSLDERLMPSGPSDTEGGGFRVVYHGTVTWHYGIDTLVEALARISTEVPDASLEVYGAGDVVDVIRKRAEDLAIGDRVRLNGKYLPQAEVLKRVQGAGVGVVANRAIERNAVALPTKLLEYVALGIPVVTADLPAIREHFSEREVVFFRPGDPDALADALLSIARDPGAAATRARAALERYQAYRWPLHARRYEALLEKLLS